MEIVVRAAVIYAFVWLVLRALGKRELGELTAFELVLLFSPQTVMNRPAPGMHLDAG